MHGPRLVAFRLSNVTGLRCTSANAMRRCFRISSGSIPQSVQPAGSSPWSLTYSSVLCRGTCLAVTAIPRRERQTALQSRNQAAGTRVRFNPKVPMSEGLQTLTAVLSA